MSAPAPREVSAQSCRQAFAPFSLGGIRAVRFQGLHQANALRSQTDDVAKAALTFVRLRKCGRLLQRALQPQIAARPGSYESAARLPQKGSRPYELPSRVIFNPTGLDTLSLFRPSAFGPPNRFAEPRSPTQNRSAECSGKFPE